MPVGGFFATPHIVADLPIGVSCMPLMGFATWNLYPDLIQIGVGVFAHKYIELSQVNPCRDNL